MEKIKNIYYNDKEKNNYRTGLYLETESGKLYSNHTTDFIIPFEKIDKLPKPILTKKELRWGDKVESTPKAVEYGLFSRKKVTGIFLGYNREGNMVVATEGRCTVPTYNKIFWKKLIN